MEIQKKEPQKTVALFSLEYVKDLTVRIIFHLLEALLSCF